MTVFPDLYVCYCVGPSWPSPRKKGAKIPEVLLFFSKKINQIRWFGDGEGFGD